MSLPWDDARAVAATSFGRLETIPVAPADADGLVLGGSVMAATDLPAFTSSAMDGWAVSGPPPWRLVDPAVEAGTWPDLRLHTGEAVRIATGAPVPEGADAVLRHENGTEAGSRVHLHPGSAVPAAGTDVRSAAAECRAGDVVAAAGTVLVPALLGLVAAAGADVVHVVRRPSVDVVVTGDELVLTGRVSGGAVRDALGPMLPAWLARLGCGPVTVRVVDGSQAGLADAVAGSSADVVVTTGSTGAGPRDHLHGVLASAGAALLVDGVDVRPGHPMLLARLADGRPLCGLPGNPLAAVSGLVTLVTPVVRALAGRASADPPARPLADAVTGHPSDVRLVPVREGVPVHHVGPAMLRGLAAADGLAVVPPGGAVAGALVRVLSVP